MAFDPASEGATLASSKFDPASEGATLASTQQKPQPAQSTLQNIVSGIRNILPNPQLPLGLNVASGLLSAGMKPAQRSVFQQLPQIATGSNYGIPQRIASGVGNAIPSLMAGGESLLGQAITGGALGAAQAQPGQRLTSGLENSLSTIGIGKMLPALGNIASGLMIKSPLEKVASTIQGAHDSLAEKAAQGFVQVSKGINDRGINQVPLPGTLVKDLSSAVDRNYFPDIPQTHDLINKASQGDYNALRDLQSELWTRGTKASSSDSYIENNKGEEMFNLRDRINQSIGDHLVNTGNDDLNNILNQSRDDYKNLKETFYNKNLDPGLKKLVNPDIRQVPDNLSKLMQNYSVPREKLKNAVMNPSPPSWGGNAISSLPQQISAHNVQNSLWPIAKGLGIGTFGLGELGALWKLMHPTPMQNS